MKSTTFRSRYGLSVTGETASGEFKKYLADELAFADSYIPAAKAGPFLEEQLALINANMPKKS